MKGVISPMSKSTTRRRAWRRAWLRWTAFGAAIVASLALAVPTASAEGCASTCSVGGAGAGGENSDGQAQGFRLKGLSTGCNQLATGGIEYQRLAAIRRQSDHS